MQTVTKLTDFNKSLIGLSSDIFYVTINSTENSVHTRFTPSAAAEWLYNHADSVVTSDRHSVTIKVGSKTMKVVVWRRISEVVDLMGI